MPFSPKIIFLFKEKKSFLEFDPQKLNKYHIKSCPTASYNISDSPQKLNKNSISQSEQHSVLLLDVVGDVELQITLNPRQLKLPLLTAGTVPM